MKKSLFNYKKELFTELSKEYDVNDANFYKLFEANTKKFGSIVDDRDQANIKAIVTKAIKDSFPAKVAQNAPVLETTTASTVNIDGGYKIDVKDAFESSSFNVSSTTISMENLQVDAKKMLLEAQGNISITGSKITGKSLFMKVGQNQENSNVTTLFSSAPKEVTSTSTTIAKPEEVATTTTPVLENVSNNNSLYSNSAGGNFNTPKESSNSQDLNGLESIGTSADASSNEAALSGDVESHNSDSI